jgi:hypothetical protein
MPQIVFIHNIVTIKNSPCLVPGNHHCHPFRNTRPNHISYGGSPKIMKKTFSELSFLKGGVPCASNIIDSALSVNAWKNIMAQLSSLFSLWL